MCIENQIDLPIQRIELIPSIISKLNPTTIPTSESDSYLLLEILLFIVLVMGQYFVDGPQAIHRRLSIVVTLKPLIHDRDVIATSHCYPTQEFELFRLDVVWQQTTSVFITKETLEVMAEN